MINQPPTVSVYAFGPPKCRPIHILITTPELVLDSIQQHSLKLSPNHFYVVEQANPYQLAYYNQNIEEITQEQFQVLRLVLTTG